MRSIPSANLPAVDPATGRLMPEWFAHFANRNAAPGRIVSLAPSVSPFTFTASVSGHLLVNGGTVSSVSLTRARIALVTGLVAGFVPMSAGDVVTIAFTVAPAVSFIPE